MKHFAAEPENEAVPGARAPKSIARDAEWFRLKSWLWFWGYEPRPTTYPCPKGSRCKVCGGAGLVVFEPVARR